MTYNVLTCDEFLDPVLKSRELDTKNIQELLDEYLKDIEKAKKEMTSNEQEHEEHFKNIFNRFFFNIYGYKNNTHHRIDSVIHQDDRLRVIIEVKRPSNQQEMIQDNDFNKKAFHESLLYFYEQRQKNVTSINYILITDCEKLYLISSESFEKLIKDKAIRNILDDFKTKSSEIIRTTNDLYIALQPILKDINIEISTCLIDLQDPNLNPDELYKLFSEYTIFKTPLDNDANELAPRFYRELIYIMGLKEDKDFALVDNGVKNSLLHLTQEIVKNQTPTVDIFETALSLNILWLNRILFLKLLESQLKAVRNDDKFTLLDPAKTANSLTLYNLFFNILNKPRNERSEEYQETYQYIPYLNSSLFVPASIETHYAISSIDGNRHIKVQSGSILGDKYSGKEMPLLEYLLSFLNCFQYNREKEGCDPNTVIKSSVLGLVFEQLNGYKDGSYFTPASITMYMCKQVIHKQIIQQFNEIFDLKCNNIDELENYASANFYKNDIREKALKIIDNITIIDPAVGSGHFLVSALNELIALKSRLGLLHNHIKVHIDNDELLITYHDGKPFIYQISDNHITEVQKEIQILIFNTKKYIIENQLFGVDINPNSVNICRLRLWIELLKHSFFTDTKLIDMEVLPNLEFKVITANSLIAIPDMPLYFDKDKQAILRNEMHRYYHANLEEKETVKENVLELINKVKIDSQLHILYHYNPFDTQVSSPFFDSGLMFGLEHFDIVIGNPPYVSNKGISSEMMSKYKKEYGEQDDLYNYFYHRGFDFLKENGILGYITSNTFLTIQSKQKLRQFLQEKQLLEMRLIDNVFENAAVEPIIVIAQNCAKDNYCFDYIDNRSQQILLSDDNKISISMNTYKNAPNQVFFTPTDYNLGIADRYFTTIKTLIEEYWNMIKTSANIEKSKQFLAPYRQTLKAGDITLLGLLTDGGVGLQTGENGYYIGVRDHTKDAERTKKQRLEKIAKFNKEHKTNHDITNIPEQEIRDLFTDLKAQYGRDVFGQGFLYQIVSDHEIADVTTLKQDEKDNGISGEACFVPYDKGDKDGNRWYMPTVYYIHWSKENV
ncbi:MAG: Eco57I restriction-modification methylase domain-containing protein, partial [Brevinema sp.]